MEMLFSIVCGLTFDLFLRLPFESYLQIPGDKILGVAYFFLGIGVPGNTKDLFNQIESLACLENNK